MASRNFSWVSLGRRRDRPKDVCSFVLIMILARRRFGISLWVTYWIRVRTRLDLNEVMESSYVLSEYFYYIYLDCETLL